MIDLPAIEVRLAKATPFCSCRILVKTISAGDSSSTPQTANTVSGGYELIPCEFHGNAPTDLRALVDRVRALEGAMKQYARHLYSCQTNYENRFPGSPCTCGLEAALHPTGHSA